MPPCHWHHSFNLLSICASVTGKVDEPDGISCRDVRTVPAKLSSTVAHLEGRRKYYRNATAATAVAENKTSSAPGFLRRMRRAERLARLNIRHFMHYARL